MNYMDSTMLAIGDNTQLFLDNLIVEASHDVTKTTHQPRKDPANPLIIKDRPWEHLPYFTCSNHVVLRDSQDGLFKCWYEDLIDHSGKKYLIEARVCGRSLVQRHFNRAQWLDDQLAVGHER